MPWILSNTSFWFRRSSDDVFSKHTVVLMSAVLQEGETGCKCNGESPLVSNLFFYFLFLNVFFNFFFFSIIFWLKLWDGYHPGWFIPVLDLFDQRAWKGTGKSVIWDALFLSIQQSNEIVWLHGGQTHLSVWEKKWKHSFFEYHQSEGDTGKEKHGCRVVMWPSLPPGPRIPYALVR